VEGESDITNDWVQNFLSFLEKESGKELKITDDQIAKFLNFLEMEVMNDSESDDDTDDLKNGDDKPKEWG
jgi:hypothetical protein